MSRPKIKRRDRGEHIYPDYHEILKGSSNAWLKRMRKKNQIFSFFEQYGIAMIVIIVAVALTIKRYLF